MKLDRITSNPNRMNGQPSIRNLRLTVRRVIELLVTYPDREELRQEFPELEDEDIQQALIFVSSYLSDRIIELPNCLMSNHFSTQKNKAIIDLIGFQLN
ncbi:MAG: DUF433 domain-containing protein [Nostoc sp.]|uniref:DUF433 domain-containing protein n=1 Tax=Nostoc sp. TaxID=1180 RepID=UPI002FFA038C